MPATRERTEYEKERGKPLPSRNHSRVQLRLGSAFLEYEPDVTSFSERSLDLGGLRVTPDLCVYGPREVDFSRDVVVETEPPLLAVEIESPLQGTQALLDKAHALLAAGVHSVWIVHPAIQAITALSADAGQQTVTHGAVRDPATGIEVDLSDLFAA